MIGKNIQAYSGSPLRFGLGAYGVAMAFFPRATLCRQSLGLAPVYESTAAQVTVIDGDTVRDLSTGRFVRLVGFNALETTNPPCARESELGHRAKTRLQELVRGGALTLNYVACSCLPRAEGPTDETMGALAASFLQGTRTLARR
jgi:endonuclease YncB( thermonuclease family)